MKGEDLVVVVKEDYAEVIKGIQEKANKTKSGETDKPIYRVRTVFSDTSFLKEVLEKQAQEAK